MSSSNLSDTSWIDVTPTNDSLVRPEAGRIDVWFARLPELDFPRQEELASDEWDRANRFRIPKPREQFAKARLFVRRVLGRYLSIPPCEIRFSFKQRGKPFLADDRLQFNLSHSGDAVLLAVSDGIELGADIEFVDAFRDLEGLAKRYFSAREFAELMVLEGENRTRGFFNCWSRKEAFIKAIGDGLAYPLDRFSVRLSPNAPAQFLEFVDEADAINRWRLFDVNVGSLWSAAVVGDQEATGLACFRVSPGC